MIQLQGAGLLIIINILEGELGVSFVPVVEFPPLEELVLTDDIAPLRAHPGAGGQEGLEGEAGEHHLQHLRW